MGEAARSTALPRFLLLYAALYAAFGVASPFLPAFLSMRGLPATQLGLVLGTGTAVRMLTAPLAGRLGDVLQRLRGVLVVCTALAAADRACQQQRQAVSHCEGPDAPVEGGHP